MNKRGITAVLLSGVLSGILLAGCSDSGDSQGNTSSGAAPAAGQAEGGAPPAADQGAGQGSTAGKDTAAQAPDLRIDQRAIIYNGSISVRVNDVNAAAAQITSIAAGNGGFVGGDERHSGGSGSATATIKLRIPGDKFTAVVDQIAGLGKEENRGINTEDVTEQVVDLDARIEVQKARVESGRRLLGEAKSLEDLVMLEREVASRESDLASLEGKKRRLSDLTSLSTITVALLGPQAAVAVEPDDEPAGFLGGLSNGWNALVASLSVLLTVLGALLPWIVALGVPAWAVLHLLRRYRRRDTPAPVTEAPTT